MELTGNNPKKEELQMSTSLLDEELILLDYTADDKERLLAQLAAVLHSRGYVKESYGPAVIEREAVFPTGLKTLGVEVAVPHTDPRHVKQAAILVARLAAPVTFKEMGNSGREVAVKLVFMLAVTDPKEHLTTLSKLMAIFSDKEKLLTLYQSDSPKTMISRLDKILA